MRHIEPKDVPVREVFSYLLGGVVPRPIALVSTLSADGIPNLSPFSFFNAFGANPPMIAFAPSRRGRDATLKDTYNNLIATGECVVQAVTYAMVEQVSLASTEYPPDVDEFIKSGLSPIPSDIVKPSRVTESPFQMECRLFQMVALGDGPSSGNLAICEVLKFHIAERVFENGVIQPEQIDLVARMGADYYCRASGKSVFEVKKPGERLGVGYDQIPDYIRVSEILSANNLGQLGNIEKIPNENEVIKFENQLERLGIESNQFDDSAETGDYQKMMAAAISPADKTPAERCRQVELAIKCAIEKKDLGFAWKAVLVRGQIAEKGSNATRQ